MSSYRHHENCQRRPPTIKRRFLNINRCTRPTSCNRSGPRPPSRDQIPPPLFPTHPTSYKILSSSVVFLHPATSNYSVRVHPLLSNEWHIDFIKNSSGLSEVLQPGVTRFLARFDSPDAINRKLSMKRIVNLFDTYLENDIYFNSLFGITAMASVS